ncbi:ABC transporter substrate-binding protein [Hyphomonas sp.]|uniref:MlaC/ttg2D family ABC transporter substrate-binding protein n=1 Tax=Hyphomonas sp. TaxID=87 RepID=UPI001BCBE786
MKRFILPAILAATLAVSALPAFADAKTEAYVQKNANEVLATLNNPDLSAIERTEKFSDYMDEFADFGAISNFVIGKYSRRFSQADLTRYRTAFRNYAMAVYENELDAYRGEAVTVKNSVDRSATDSIVNTVIKRRDGRDMDVRWRVHGEEGNYQVVDVALNLDGNLIWLAIEQRAQFIALLDQNNGSADVLISKINAMTADLKSRKRS